MMNQGAAKRIGQRLGTLEGVDNNSSKIGSFLRLRVELDITKPLRRCILLVGTKGKGNMCGRLRYERLHIFCFECGILRHIEVECHQNEDATRCQERTKQYGDCLRVSPLKKSYMSYIRSAGNLNLNPGYKKPMRIDG
ncbi:hypothetical protein REPUB_Repub07fG0097900 [Reevesia pubescens]